MKPIIIKRSTIYLIWVIPIIAIIISGIMLFNEYAKMGESVVIIFKDARGFKQDETPIKYKGILIGTVKDIEVDPENLDKFVVTAKIKKSFVKYLTEGARFWKVSPKLKPTEFTGLSTIFSGTYIEFSPATSDPQKLAKLKSKRKFYGFEEEPKTNVTYFKLYSEDGSLIEGAPVLYKNFLVGNITKKSLKKDKVEYIISINNQFASLVKVDSHFWKISPVDIKASLPDFNLKINNVFNFFFGGIQFDSPQNSQSVCSLDKNSEQYQVCNKKGFHLFPSKGDTEYSLKKIKLVLKNAHKVQSALKLVYYRGDIAGKVVASDYVVEKDTRYLYIRMKRKYSVFLSYRSVFWIEQPSLENLSVQSIIKGSHIEFSFYNKKDTPKDEYPLFHSRPYNNVQKVVLLANSNTGLKKGDYIFYGRSVIGEVVSVQLEDTKEKYNCIIYNDYKHLLKENPVFYKKSGFEGEVSIEGASFNVSPLKELFLGGVALLKGHKLKTRSDKFVYPLLKSRKDAERYIYIHGEGLRLSLYTDTLKGIYNEMPVYYGGLKIGKIYDINFNSKRNKFVLSAFIEGKYSSVVNGNSLFCKTSGIDVKMGLNGFEIKTEGLVAILKGSIVLINKTGKSNSAPKKEYNLLSQSQLERLNYVEAFLIADRAYGLKKESPVLYKGVAVGKVKNLSVENGSVKITMLILKNYSYLLSENSKFYIENTKVSAGEVKNISSSIFGSMIKIAYFKSGKGKKTFLLAGVNPSDTVYREGFRVLVFAKQIGSLEIGSPVINRGVKIGEIEGIDFSENLDCIQLTLFIEQKYKTLLTDRSTFKEIKPLALKTGFIYAKVDFKSFSTLIKGGLELINKGKGSQIEEWHRFYLENEKK